MQSPLETAVQALRNTRFVEEICAWTTGGTLFPQTLFMHGLVPNRRRSSLTCGVTLIVLVPMRLWPILFITRPMQWISGELISRTDAKSSSPTAFTDVRLAKAWLLLCG